MNLSSRLPDTIKLPDIQILRSLGAMGRNFFVMDLGTGEQYMLAPDTKITNIQVFAGKGTKHPYRTAEKYAERYGGSPDEWQHVKGNGYLRTDEGDRPAEIHWSRAEGIGDFEHFVKRWLDE